MSAREQTSTQEALDDMYEPALGELDDDFELATPFSSEKQRLAAKRRQAERRLEERRLREELGDYDLELDDF